MKECTGCKLLLPVHNFYHNPKIRPDGVRARCNACRGKQRKGNTTATSRATKQAWEDANRDKINAKAREYRKANPDKFKQYSLKKTFGISKALYDFMLAAQGGVCAICRELEPGHLNGKRKSLAVDHCHKTNKIRGLLCWPCNSALGKFKDKPENLAAAILYLTKADK